jgi:hypothetical protein
MRNQYNPAEPTESAICACNNGWVSIGQTVIDEETSDEAEELNLFPCKRCNERNK